MGLRPTYRDENPQRSWGGPSAQAWRTHSCVPRRDFSRRLWADATVQAQAPRRVDIWRMVLEATQHELIEACQRGEREAFRLLFEKHKDTVYSVGLRYAADE